MRSDVTQILARMNTGETNLADHLLPIVYEELRRVAKAKLASERPGLTLQATALVHEAYLRLVGADQPQNWNGRGHFFAAAAEAMRRILVEGARRRHSLKRGGEFSRITLDEAELPGTGQVEELFALNDALDVLSQEDPRKAEIVKLRFFGGLTGKETAEALGISPSMVDREWAFSKAWLQTRMQE